jgi:hypothetical protein
MKLAAINLIALFNFYLIITFVLSIATRYRQYRILVGLIVSAPLRWPKLIQLAHRHRTLFINWPTLLPVVLTFFLMVVHSVLYNELWPSARVTPHELRDHPAWLVIVLVLGAAMLFLDGDAIFRVGRFDRAALEKSLDQAEYWLRSWAAPAVRLLTFGFVNPRRMVHDEVSKSLREATVEVSKMMWRWSLQIGVRLGFGLSIWLGWAIVL